MAMNFHCSLKVIKEREQKGKISKKQQKLHHQTTEIKQVEQIATPRYNYSLSQIFGVPSIAPGFQRSLNSSTLATVSFIRPSGKFFL